MKPTAAHALQLDLQLAQSSRDEGIARILRTHGSFIARAREVAVLLAERNGSVTADDLRAELEPLGVKPAHQNAWGACFLRHPRLTWTGEYRVSANVRGNGNIQRVWRAR